MPCSDGGPSREQVEAARNIPAILCAVLDALDRRGIRLDVFRECDWVEAGVNRDWAEGWWAMHRAEDAVRREREIRERDQREARAALVRSAASKLTLEERRALGIPAPGGDGKGEGV